MDDLEFLRLRPAGQASLTVTLQDGVVSTIDDINIDVIGEKCPLLALAFEPGPRGPKYSIEEASLSVVASFLRFLYLGDYYCLDTYGFPKPCSLLLHAQLCRMGEIYDVPELSSAAHVSIIHETQESCSHPTPPLDLCEAIRFLYTKLHHQRPLIDTILHYCVSCFTQHKLGENEEFCKVVYELVPFHKDLFKINYERRFEDEGEQTYFLSSHIQIDGMELMGRAGAIDIVRLPSCKTQPPPQVFRDFVFELFGSWPEDGQATPRAQPRRPTETDSNSDERPFCLVHRPRDALDDAAVLTNSDSEASAPEDEGFTLVYRTKRCSFQPQQEPEDQTQAKIPRTFDPSIPCSPASPHPQKIIRGFEPVKGQNAIAGQPEHGLMGDIPASSGGTRNPLAPWHEDWQNAPVLAPAEAFHTNSLIQVSNDSRFESNRRSATASLEANRDLFSLPLRHPPPPPTRLTAHNEAKLSFPTLPSTPRSPAFKSKVKKTAATSPTKARSDATKRMTHALEEELRNDEEKNKVLTNKAFDPDEDLIDLQVDAETTMIHEEVSGSDSEWSMV